MKRISFSVKKFAVDRAAGILTDLALVIGGREAKGHGIYLDAKTLQGGLDSVNEKGGLLRGAVCHETFTNYLNDEDRLLEVPGYFSDISIEGDTLRAGSFQFYDSFKADQPEAYRRLMEMAEKTPTLFGLSIEATGYAVYVDEQGNEYSQRPEDVDLAYEGMPPFRIVDLTAAAFVSARLALIIPPIIGEMPVAAITNCGSVANGTGRSAIVSAIGPSYAASPRASLASLSVCVCCACVRSSSWRRRSLGRMSSKRHTRSSP